MKTKRYTVTVIDPRMGEVGYVTEAANAQIAKANARAFFGSMKIVRVEVEA